jgi:hypothetical protein
MWGIAKENDLEPMWKMDFEKEGKIKERKERRKFSN